MGVTGSDRDRKWEGQEVIGTGSGRGRKCSQQTESGINTIVSIIIATLYLVTKSTLTK